MTAQQEVVLLQLLQQLVIKSDHTVMDQTLVQILSKLHDRLGTVLDLLTAIHARLAQETGSLSQAHEDLGLTDGSRAVSSGRI